MLLAVRADATVPGATSNAAALARMDFIYYPDSGDVPKFHLGLRAKGKNPVVRRELRS